MPLLRNGMHRRVLEDLREKHRRRYAAFLEFHRVVHTAQRAGPSPAERGGGDLHLLRHLVQAAPRVAGFEKNSLRRMITLATP